MPYILAKKKEILFKHKLDGGLGIRNVATLNVALLGNQAWRLHSCPTLLASRVFRGKYGKRPVELGMGSCSLNNASWAGRSFVGSIAQLKGDFRRLSEMESLHMISLMFGLVIVCYL